MRTHYFNRWLLLLLPLAMFSACKDYDGSPFDEDGYYRVFDDNRISLAFTVENPATTRMSDAITQANDVTNGTAFRGISDLVLLPFQVTATGSDCIGANNSALVGQNVLENNLINPGATSDPAGTPAQIYNNGSGGANSKYYLDSPLPIGTNAFLVYGRATGNNSSLAEKQSNGILTSNNVPGSSPSAISFSPVQMVTAPTSAGAAGIVGDNIITYLNSIFTSDWTDSDNTILYNLLPMVQAMKAGSSANVLAFVDKIYELLLPSKEIGYVGDVLKAILNVETLPETMPAHVTALPSSPNCQGFPADLGLPDGAAVIEWDNNAFKAVTNRNNLSTMNTDVTKFVFPAELYYRANSRIHTSNIPLTNAVDQAKTIFNRPAWGNLEEDDETSVLKQKIPNSSQNLFTANGTVLSTTTVVAITDPLQYAVGRLEAVVGVDGNYDREENLFIPDANNTPIIVGANTFPVTGILIGGQKPVNYLFQPQANFADADAFTIYDSQIDGVTLPAIKYDDSDETTLSASTHTLVLETEAGKPINVALEILNNSGEEFYAKEKISETVTELRAVPNGCKFYLVGQLDPGTADKVFTQDHFTKVTFTISSLADAYYFIPTLTSQDLVFSLGVIDWKMSTPSSTLLK